MSDQQSSYHVDSYVAVWQKSLWDYTGEISSELYHDWLWDGNFKFSLICTHFSRFSPFSGYIWWNNTLSSLENFPLNSILVFVFLMSHHDNGGFLKNLFLYHGYQHWSLRIMIFISWTSIMCSTVVFVFCTVSTSPQLSGCDTRTVTAFICKWRSSYHFQQ